MNQRTWTVVAAVSVAAVLIVGSGLVLRARSGGGPPAPAAAASAPAAVELAATDLARATTQDLVQTVDISGGLMAVETALVKSRIAAELRTLTVREGDPVKAGQRIATLDDTEAGWRLRQAEDQAAAAQAQLDIAERTLANNRALVAQGFISRNALDTADSNVAAAAASRAAAQAAVELARKSVRDAVVTAPISGTVSQRFVQPGERLVIDARIVEIVDLARLELAAPLAPAEVAALRVGQTAQLRVEGLAEPVAARLVRINPATQAGTRAVMVYLAVAPAPGLRQGLFAQGVIELERRPARVVPLSALRVDGARPYLLLADQGQVQRLEVTPGQRGLASFGGAPEAAVEIATGLPEGATVLRGTVGSLRAGTSIKTP
jgi:RND family efflux transporter MFP subunit